MKSFWKPNWKRVIFVGIGYITIQILLTSMGYGLNTWQYWVMLLAVFYVAVINSLEWE